MDIYPMNIRPKFHSDSIWNDGALGFCKERPQQEQDEYSDELIQEQQRVAVGPRNAHWVSSPRVAAARHVRAL